MIKKIKHFLMKETPKSVFVCAMAKVMEYEVLKKTKAGFIVLDPVSKQPMVFEAEQRDVHFFTTRKACTENGIKNIREHIKQCEKDIKKIK